MNSFHGPLNLCQPFGTPERPRRGPERLGRRRRVARACRGRTAFGAILSYPKEPARPVENRVETDPEAVQRERAEQDQGEPHDQVQCYAASPVELRPGTAHARHLRSPSLASTCTRLSTGTAAEPIVEIDPPPRRVNRWAGFERSGAQGSGDPPHGRRRFDSPAGLLPRPTSVRGTARSTRPSVPEERPRCSCATTLK